MRHTRRTVLAGAAGLGIAAVLRSGVARSSSAADFALGVASGDPWPDSVAGLRRLSHRYTLATLSNGNVALLANMAKHARLPWDVILSAELFGHYKPDAEVYDGACRLLDLEPAQVMMVAAHNGDLRAAAARGLRTAFVARPTEYGPAQTKDLTADGAWDVICTSFTDLAGALGC